MKKLFWLVFAAVEAAGAFFFIKGAHHTSGSTSFAAAGLGTICGVFALWFATRVLPRRKKC